MIVYLGLAFLATQAVWAYDPTLTTNFGLVGPSSGENFTSRAFEAANLPPPTPGLTLVPTFAAQFPGLTGLGIASLYFIAGPGAEVPPHTHPRTTELFFVLSGTWSVGFIDTTNTLYSAELGPGDQFVFPIGLLHYQLVTGDWNATGYSSFNGENPGVALTATSLFASTPSVPDIVLANAFNVSIKIIKGIKAGLAG